MTVGTPYYQHITDNLWFVIFILESLLCGCSVPSKLLIENSTISFTQDCSNKRFCNTNHHHNANGLRLPELICADVLPPRNYPQQFLNN